MRRECADGELQGRADARVDARCTLYAKRTDSKCGLGVFTRIGIRKNETIYKLRGERITLKQLVDRVAARTEKIDDPLQIGRRTYLDLDEMSRSFNHSCDPNAGLRDESELYALRAIKAGEQITYDYALTVAPTDWSMQCSCGSRECRNLIGDIRSVPKKRLVQYIRGGRCSDI